MIKNNNKQGFTLIELLVVIAIIGLLSTLSILALNTARARARDTKRVADVKQMQTALEMFYNETGDYPTTGITAGNSIGTGTNVYLKAIPKPPTPFDGVPCVNNTGSYTYTYTSGGVGAGGVYTIDYCLGAAVNDLPAVTILHASPSGMR